MKNSIKIRYCFGLLLILAFASGTSCITTESQEPYPILYPVELKLKSFFPHAERGIRKETSQFFSLECPTTGQGKEDKELVISLVKEFEWDSIAFLSIRLKKKYSTQVQPTDSIGITKELVKSELLFDKYYSPASDTFRILIPSFNAPGSYSLEAGIFMKSDSQKSEIPLYGPTCRYEI